MKYILYYAKDANTTIENIIRYLESLHYNLSPLYSYEISDLNELRELNKLHEFCENGLCKLNQSDELNKFKNELPYIKIYATKERDAILYKGTKDCIQFFSDQSCIIHLRDKANAYVNEFIDWEIA